MRGTNSEAAYSAVFSVLLSPPPSATDRDKVYLSTLNKLQLLLSTYSKTKGHQVAKDSHLVLSIATVGRFKIHHSFAVYLIILSVNEASGMPFISYGNLLRICWQQSLNSATAVMSYTGFPAFYDVLEFLEIAA
jgi:hypothetical protein